MTDCVSVIMSSFNSSAFIQYSIESVLSQTYPCWELLIVDDASTDNSVDIILACAAVDSRIRFSRLDKNSGPAVARNKAIEAARGRFIAFLDSDDMWSPTKLEKQIAFMKEHEYALTHCFYERMTEEGVPTGEVVRPPMQLAYKDMLKSNRIGCLTAVYDQEQLGRQFMPLIRKRQDYGLWLSILKQTPYAYCLPESLALYRLRSSSVSSNKFDLFEYQWRLFREVEGLSFVQSAYCMGWNIARKILQQ